MSHVPWVVPTDRTLRGKAVVEMAAQNAQALRNRMESHNPLEARVAEFNLRGVSAINRNDLRTADQDFRKAYALNPNNAFARNNIGYVSEIEGDRETAQFFYDSAQQALGANAKVGLATRRAFEGQKLFQAPQDNSSKVNPRVARGAEARHAQHEPILLRRRDN